MCGFTGQYNGEKLPEVIFNDLLALSKRRGPDQTGYWSNNHVQLGFNRLAILDLSSAGHQPMKSPTGRYMMVYNGEIYNHLDLRKKLLKYNYRGTSDTETITHAIESWGIEKTIQSLDGIFALAIYDQEQQTLTLARDFAGVKPLFFGTSGRAVVFASQYDQIHQHPLFKDNSINPQVLKLYLQQHFLPAPFGLHCGIEQVRPGEYITFELDGKRDYNRYWELPNQPSSTIFNSEDALKAIEKELASCVHDQMLSDVPLGAFLSGGVDSPLICSLAKQKDLNIKVFSIGSDSKIHDESERAKAFADAMHLQQELWHLNAKEALSYWDKAMDSLHEPLADFSILPTYLVSKLAKKEVTVALSGDGGDEQFFGYERFWSIGKNLPFQHLPKIARMGLYGLDKYYSGNKNLNSVLLASLQSKAHESLHSRFRTQWLDRIFPDLASENLPDYWDVYQYPNQRREADLLGNMRKAEFYGMMQKTLRKVDLASMENSLEVRVPFLQKRFIELSLQINPLLSYGKNIKKKLLKDLLAHHVPQVKDDNVKRGFSVPLGEWIRKDLYTVFSDVLLSDSLKSIGADLTSIDYLLQDHTNNKDHKWPLFTLYSLSRHL